ncbi:hypothetical protein [Corallococcus aberystwythensis]|uniref:Uncharacterized protein n=1 Tax=Corallococcus aberystwythensis TaxID=2316722 RepID=A0A3A8QUD9_9BACT|nr:hypothetical protein [Corallococcus aberystwythensis]RKH68492.1 hypothetical protein D7W81_12440 [Corallococcus aberystwythensis]
MRSQHVFAALVLLSTSARAEELKPFQKEARSSFEKSISGTLKDANTACGTRLKVKTNFNRFDPNDWDGVGYEDSCKEVLRGVAAMCERPEYKKALAKKVTGVACLFTWDLAADIARYGGMYATVDPKPSDNAKKSGTDGTQPRNVSMWKGLLTYQMHKGDKTVADDTRAVLEETLKAVPR